RVGQAGEVDVLPVVRVGHVDRALHHPGAVGGVGLVDIDGVGDLAAIQQRRLVCGLGDGPVVGALERRVRVLAHHQVLADADLNALAGAPGGRVTGGEGGCVRVRGAGPGRVLVEGLRVGEGDRVRVGIAGFAQLAALGVVDDHAAAHDLTGVAEGAICRALG